MKKILAFPLICLLAASLITGCGGNKNNTSDKSNDNTNPVASYKDGTYHAEFDRYDPRNWIPYVDVTIKDGKITKAYYDYTDETGAKRTEDKTYIEGFSGANKGMTPRQAFDKLGTELVDSQDISKVDAVSGATHSSRNFTKLVPAALEKAAAGDTTAAKVPLYTDGTYKVSADAFDENGWKPFVEVTIANDQITAVTFDYTDKSGNLKTADATYKKNMEAANGTYPEKYTGELEQQLITKQVISKVDAVTGATTSSTDFSTLVGYALDDMAEIGNNQPAVIKLGAQ
jgi:major membrane immunogen (membrane-anchored lipoprotein)